MGIVAMLQDLSQNSKFSLSPQKLFWTGLVLLLLGGALLLFLLLPALRQEFQYWYKTQVTSKSSEELPDTSDSKKEAQDSMRPVDTRFGIVIEKIGANARVLPEVDWQDPKIYQEALRHGVAHAAGTALPGASGNVFIFAHSGVDFSEAARYNAVFYLMNKLEPGDEVQLFYEDKEYRYQVTETKKVKSDAIEYLEQDKTKKTLTLMTCWPAGTTLKRLIVEAELREE